MPYGKEKAGKFNQDSNTRAMCVQQADIFSHKGTFSARQHDVFRMFVHNVHVYNVYAFVEVVCFYKQ